MKNRFLSALALALTVFSCDPVPSFAAQFTVADNYAPLRYTATASQTTFTVTWPFEAEEDLVVKVDAGATGTFATKTLTTDYTTTGESTTNGGTVVFGTGLSAGDIVVITRDSGVTDGTDFGASVTTSALNLRFDQQALALQEVESDVQKRALLLPETEPFSTVSAAMPSLADCAGKLIACKSNGRGYESVTSSLNGSSPTSVLGGTYAAAGTPISLRQGSSATREAVTLDSGEPSVDTTINHIFVGDGSTLGGLDYTPLTEADGVFNVVSCGATGDGVTDDNDAIQACVTLAKAAKGTLVFPSGTYAYTDPIDLSSPDGNGVDVVGIGNATLLKTTLTSPALLPGAGGNYENLSIRFSTRPGASDLRAVGIQLGGGVDRDDSDARVTNSTFRNINIYQTFVGILAGPITEAGESASLKGESFANSWDTILIRDFYQSAVVFDMPSGNDTGTHWANLQIKNREWDNSAQVNGAGSAMYFNNVMSMTFSTTHIDNIGDQDTPTGAPAPAITAGSSATTAVMLLTFDGLHMENLYYDEVDGGLFELRENTTLSIRGLNIQGSEFAPGVGNDFNLVVFKDSNSTAIIDGFTLNGNTAPTGTFRQSATPGAKANCAMYVRGFYESSADTGVMTVDESGNAVSDGKPLLKQWNDRIYYQETAAQGLFVSDVDTDIAIDTGVLTPLGREMLITVDTEADAATDYLDGISETPAPIDGQIYILSTANTNRDVTVRSNVTTAGADRFDLNGQVPAVLGSTEDRLVVQYEGVTGRWTEIARRTGITDQRLQLRNRSALTVASNVIAPTSSRHLIDNSGGVQTVKTITAPIGSIYDEGLLLYLSNSTTGNTVTYDETGNIILSGGTTFAADTTADTIVLLYDSVLAKWLQIGGGDNS